MFFVWKKKKSKEGEQYYLYAEHRFREGGKVKGKSIYLGSDMFTIRRRIAERYPNESLEELLAKIPPKPVVDVFGYVEAAMVLEKLAEWWKRNRYGIFGDEVLKFAWQVGEKSGLLQEFRRKWEDEAKKVWGTDGSIRGDALLRFRDKRDWKSEAILLLEEVKK
jgi:hypothetical protein